MLYISKTDADRFRMQFFIFNLWLWRSKNTLSLAHWKRMKNTREKERENTFFPKVYTFLCDVLKKKRTHHYTKTKDYLENNTNNNVLDRE